MSNRVVVEAPREKEVDYHVLFLVHLCMMGTVGVFEIGNTRRTKKDVDEYCDGRWDPGGGAAVTPSYVTSNASIVEINGERDGVSRHALRVLEERNDRGLTLEGVAGREECWRQRRDIVDLNSCMGHARRVFEN
ncbi:unnamed protein product [Sphenostylis stenocarpa]|uniref:Uncharacterized protein n=1 Tax=Sphenostylis stenocarpa TaxID=92480 RepID=A0AA86SCK1_9FABA|nr:unnamed protein product [Sphenostylis stenocarpa]